MYPALQKEIETYERRTPKSRAAHRQAARRVPLGVASNYRYYPPYPLFVREGQGARIRTWTATNTSTTISATAR